MMTQSTSKSNQSNWVGIDVSKAKLDVYEIQSAQAQRFSNDSEGIEQLSQWLMQFPQASVVCESTGGLERLAAETLSAVGISVSIVNAAQMHNF
ncbi:MAG: transposase, partial [Cyanobacteria bacterium J06607_13]